MDIVFSVIKWYNEKKSLCGKGDIMKLNKLISTLLTFTMLLSILGSITGNVFAEENIPVMQVEASRLSKEDIPYESVVYFGTANISIQEEKGIYEVPLYRDGNTESAASVEIHTNDMTAIYGQDYEIIDDSVSYTGTGETVIEKYQKQENVVSEDEFEIEEDSFAQKDESDKEAEDTFELEVDLHKDCTDEKCLLEDGKAEEPDEAEAEEPTEEEENSEERSLAELKEEQTGIETRELKEYEPEPYLAGVIEAMAPQALAELDYSSVTKVDFAPGESEKIIKIKILDDKDSEGTEAFSATLVNPEGAEVYMVTSLSVLITDDEPAIHSEISFSKSKYNSKDGKVVVTVKRKKALYSVVDFVIRSSEDTAVSGENYEEINETIAFAPYEEEREIEIPVRGEGKFKLILQDFKACDPGKTTEATINIKKDKKASKGGEAPLMLMSTSSFNITVGGKSYTVEYSGAAQKGKIMDYGYSPALQVGEYYFSADSSNGGIFNYSSSQREGSKPNSCGHYASKYVSDSVRHNSYGQVDYYHTTTWKNGKIYTYSSASIPGVFYQYITPDWESTKSFGNVAGMSSPVQGQFKLYKGSSEYSMQRKRDKFSRTQSEAAIVLKNQPYNFSARIYAADEDGGKTPKSYIKFYGLAAMAKKFRVAVTSPTTLAYRTGNGTSTVSAVPAQVNAKCGAQVLYQDEKRDLYANQDENITNMVFSISDSYVNGKNNKFGTVSGYTITIDPGPADQKMTKEYPEDFISFLNSKTTPSNGCISYSSDNVKREIDKVNRNLDTVPYDKYFIDWIESCQKGIVSDGTGYYQNLSFKPKFKYVDVSVKVLSASGTGNATFNDSELKEGSTITYHAGDVIDLAATPADSLTQHVAGYEVSTDGGTKFDVVTSTTKLFLEPHKNYVIRPVVANNTNRVEIRFENDEAKNNLSIENLIDTSNATGELKDKYILKLNGAVDNVLSVEEQMKPTVGKCYSVNINVTGKPSDSDYVYRPVVTDNMTGEKYNVTKYDFTARSKMGDNVINIAVEKVRKTDIKNYTIKGTVVSAFAPIRNDGLGIRNLPVVGNTIALDTGKYDGDFVRETKAAQSDDDGNFEILNISAKSGDQVTMLVSDGYSDPRIVTTVIKDSSADNSCVHNAGMLKLSYPSDMPSVTTIMYDYGKATNRAKADIRENSVCIYDDTLYITAIANTNGRKLSKAVFTVYTVTGEETTYEATDNGSGVFECQIPKMVDNLHSGDRVKVHLVDSESIGNDVEGNPMQIRYPDVDTGLVFYTENKLVAPQSYDINDSGAADIPILGPTKGTAQSGLLTFSKTRWTGDTGWTLSINADFTPVGGKAFSTEEKVKGYQGYQKAVQKAYKERDYFVNAYDKTSEALVNNYLFGDDDMSEEDFLREVDAVTAQKARNQKNMEKMGSNAAKDSMAGLNNKILSVKVMFVLLFDFVYNPTLDEYVFTSGSVTVGGTFTYMKTMYTMISSFPCFVNIVGTIQGDLVVAYAQRADIESLTAGEFEEYSGNLAKKFAGYGLVGEDGEYNPAKANINIMFSGKIQMGTGLCGILAARGYVGLALQFNIPVDRDSAGFGTLFTANGGIGFDILITSIDINVASFKVGTGTLEHQAEFGFFGGLLSPDKMSPSLMSMEEEMEESEDEIIGVTDFGEVVSLHDYSAGSSDMSAFGGNNLKRASLAPVSIKVLLDEAAERTRPHIENLGDGKKFITFIGNRGNETNERCLYYSLSEGDVWSDPIAVADDGTFDGDPYVVHRDGKVYIVWIDANKPISKEDSLIDNLKTLGVSAAVYDVKSGVMSEEFNLVDDEFFNLNPRLVADKDNLYLTYMKRDVNGIKDEQELINLESNYSTMAGIKFNITEKEADPEKYTVIEHESIVDPLVFDYRTAVAEVYDETYMLTTYTIDEDEELKSSEDRELYLVIHNLENDTRYYPIKITNDNVSQSSPKLSKIGDKVYLSWISEGHLFNLLNATELLESLFDENIVGTVYKDSESDDKDWYKKDAGDLSLSDEEYERSIYCDIAQNSNFRADVADFKQREGVTSNISDYIVTTNGDDIYIFFTEFGSERDDDTGVELYGVSYKRYISETDEESEGEAKDTDWGFSKSVQITDYGKVIDELDLIMTEDNRISTVSNFYSQWIDEEGNINYSSNSLVEIDFEPRNSMKVKDNYITIPQRLVPGETVDVMFEAVNEGLIDTAGYDIRLSEVRGGVENIIYTESVENELRAGETAEHHINWTVPENLEDTSLKVTLSENSTGSSEEHSAEVEVPYSADIDISYIDVIHNENGNYTVKATAENIGNKPSGELDGAVCMVEGTEEAKEYASFEIGTLAPGERKEIEATFNVLAQDFSHYGIIELKLKAMEGDENITEVYSRISSSKPVMAEIEKGKETLSLDLKESHTLTTKAAPWGELAGKPIYYSADASVAKVNDAGKVTGVSEGETVIYAYFHEGGLIDKINVKVTENNSVLAPTGSSGGGGTTIKRFEITLNTNGGSELEKLSVAKNTSIEEIEIPIKEGFVFDGWYKDAELTIPYDLTEKVTENMTLYAKWSEEKEWVNPFTDVKEDNWFYGDVEYVSENGLMNGVEETLFAPNEKLTRGMLVTVLYRKEGEPAVNKSIPFSDVDMNAYYANAVIWAQQNGIVKGVEETLFAPNAYITREQLATIIYRYAKFKEKAPVGAWAIRLDYSDLEEISEYALEAVMYCTKDGIMQGREGKCFAPADNATRAETAAILHRFIESTK